MPNRAARAPRSPLSFPGLLGGSILARLPYGMGAVGLLSTGVARGYPPSQTGVLAALYTTALALSTPLWGRVADRSGLRRVLFVCAALNVAGTYSATADRRFATTAAGALLIGCGSPPVSAAMRVAWNRLLKDSAARRRAATMESVLAEGVHVVGRLVVAGAGALGAATVLPLQAGLLVVGGLVLAANPRIREARTSTAITGGFLDTLRRGRHMFAVTLLMCTGHGGAATAIVMSAPGRTAAAGALLLALSRCGEPAARQGASSSYDGCRESSRSKSCWSDSSASPPGAL